MTTSRATNFKANYSDTSELMTALDIEGIESDQGWENETMTWTFEDGSKIVVCNSDVEVKGEGEGEGEGESFE